MVHNTKDQLIHPKAVMDKTTTQVLNKEIENLNNTTDQVDLIDI